MTRPRNGHRSSRSPGSESPSGTKGFFLALVCAAATGLLMYAGFPPLEIRLAPWLALVPLLHLSASWSPLRSAFWFAASGFVFASLGLSWIYRLAPPGGAGVAVYMAFYWGCFGLLAPGFSRILYPVGPLLHASSWVALEFIRSRLFGGFPWLNLGHTQVDFLALIQIADLTGVYGITFLLVFISSLLAGGLRLVQGKDRSPARLIVGLGLGGGAIGAALLYGWFRLKTIEEIPGPRMAAIQAEIDVLDKQGYDARSIVLRHHRLSLAAADEEPPPDLIVWSETMAPAVSATDPEALRDLKALAVRYEASLLVGAEALGPESEPGRLERRNRAIFIDRITGTTGTYDKIHLVPFGEFVPAKSVLPFRETWESMIREAMGLVPDLTAGTEAPLFELTTDGGKVYRIGAMICYDSVFARLLPRFDLERADVFVNLSNDGWYLGTAQPQQILDITAFRAVESRRGLFRAANLGLSAVISPLGRVEVIPVPRLDSGDPEALPSQARTVPTARERSPYSVIGECFAWSCLLLSAAGLAARFRRRTRP